MAFPNLPNNSLRSGSWRFFYAAIAFACLLTTIRAQAESPGVTAVLDNSDTAVGHPVQLQIKVTGSASATPPGNITVDGLDIRSSGVSRQYEMNNFNVSYSFIYNYTIMPLKTGQFKIPPQSVRIGNNSLSTPELTLNVVDSRRGSSGSNPRRDSIDPEKVGFVELILPKTDAFVGEIVPAQIRVGFNARVPVESLGAGVQIAGQGFTTQKIPDARETTETIDGRRYHVFIFKTAIAAARTGKIEIGPAEINPVVRVARTSQRRDRPRNPFGVDDPFFDSFFDDPFLTPSIPREIKLRSAPTTLEIKPLPPNAPPNFSGAIGIFTMKAEANPTTVQLGDPVTLTAIISGRGNFDRVTAPAFEDDRGWHKYPPSAKFQQDDDVGISGAKTFEIVLSAKERKDHVPIVVFSYFDPVKETYVTLRSEQIPIAIEGGAAAAPTPAAAASAASSPASVQQPQPAQQDILYQLTDPPAALQSFTPFYVRASFWIAQGVALLGLLGLVAWKVRQAKLHNREAQRLAALHEEASALERKLRRVQGTPQEYFADASRAIQIKTALIKKLNPNAIEAEDVARAFNVDEETRNRLRRLFARRDELRYSGGHNGAETISPEVREDVTQLLEQLRK